MVKTSPSKPSLSVQVIVLAEIFWAVAALLFFLVGGIALGRGDVPFWYEFGTSMFELTAFLVAALLCLRNWGSSQIVSGRHVWLFIGLGLFCYFLGSFLFTYWETGLGQKPDVSPGDLLYVPAYIFLIIGMVQAVINRRLNLEIWQWGVVSLIALVGGLLAYVVSVPSGQPEAWLMPPAIAQTAPAAVQTPPKPAVKASPSPKATSTPTPAAKPSVAPAADVVPAKPSSTPLATPGVASPVAAPVETKPTAPEWAVAIERFLAPLKGPLNWYYVASDIFLLIVATILLLAFWGGRFAQSWRLIAAAAFCQYIADIWFKYATLKVVNYQSGGLLEVFWVFSAVLFGIGAALEYDLSSRTRSRSGSRRRAT